MIFPEYNELTLDQLFNERKSVGIQLTGLGRQYHNLRDRIDNINLRIRAKKNGEQGIGISDHAVLRYLERIKGVDMTEVRNEIRKHIATKHIVKASDQIITDKVMSVAIYDGAHIATIWHEEQRGDLTNPPEKKL